MHKLRKQYDDIRADNTALTAQVQKVQNELTRCDLLAGLSKSDEALRLRASIDATEAKYVYYIETLEILASFPFYRSWLALATPVMQPLLPSCLAGLLASCRIGLFNFSVIFAIFLSGCWLASSALLSCYPLSKCTRT